MLTFCFCLLFLLCVPLWRSGNALHLYVIHTGEMQRSLVQSWMEAMMNSFFFIFLFLFLFFNIPISPHYSLLETYSISPHTGHSRHSTTGK
ncbi:hypothetical protein GGR50DRAFT_19862 [Xylaria sp. CBS 124048]|nr:hypothetical protein GGR50DRAFT_19862 [Xylaria sp. CBS 124048]